VPNIQPENNYFYVFTFVVNLGAVNILLPKIPKIPREKIRFTFRVPYPIYMELKKESIKRGISIPKLCVEKIRANAAKEGVTYTTPITQEDIDAYELGKKRVGMGEHRRIIEAKAIKCRRAKRTSQNIDTQI
jgi:hypothetical protein